MAETLLFWAMAVVAVAGALGVVIAPKAVYSAIALATTMIALAVLYIAQGAPFLGVVQIVVYTGAVMMLFLFVLMLIGVDSSESLIETLRGQRLAAIIAGLGFGILLIAGIGTLTTTTATATNLAKGNVEGLAALIFTRYLWAFELTGALLITAALGAMVLAHRERFERRKTQRELAIERFTPGAHPTTLPNPGVYARHNAVDVPARLPDGSGSELSVSAILRVRPVPASTDEHVTDERSREEHVTDERSREEHVTDERSREEHVTDERSREEHVTDERSREEHVTAGGDHGSG